MTEEEKDYLEETEKSFSWKDKLLRDGRGVVLKKPDNFILFLENYPKYAGKLMYNEFLCQREFDGEVFSDAKQEIIYNDVERGLGIYNRSMVDSSLSEVFENHKYNPVVDYIKSLKWDGKERIETLFIDLLQADDTELNRTFTKKWMIAAIKRVLEPGSKFDNMIILQGSQGIGKSTICERLAKGFFSTVSLAEIDNKDIIDKMNKTWIAIIDEMDNFNKKEMTNVKTFLSKFEDEARLAYARNTVKFKRHCVFIGSTNDDTFLRDNTSDVERRFWIIKCNKTKMDATVRKTMTDDFVGQLWAEAYHYYEENPNQYIDIEPELFDDFAKAQKEYKKYNNDDVVDFVKNLLEKQYVIGIDGEITAINQLDTDLMTGEKHYINKIPGFILSQYINRQIKTDRAIKYIGQALSPEWEYKQVRFKKLGTSYKGLVRTSDKNESSEGKKYNPMDEFTVGLNI